MTARTTALMSSSFELVVCITSTALFDCSESHNIWVQKGLKAYQKHQRKQASIPLKPGVAFPLVQSLLELNKVTGKQLVEVVLVSRNDSISGERVRNSITHHKLLITRMSFTGGTDVTRYLVAWNCNLFLTTEEAQVRTVLSGTAPTSFKGIAAALVYNIMTEAICHESTLL
jgi:5'-nucleotidase